jgi:hypothetical protein
MSDKDQGNSMGPPTSDSDGFDPFGPKDENLDGSDEFQKEIESDLNELVNSLGGQPDPVDPDEEDEPTLPSLNLPGMSLGPQQQGPIDPTEIPDPGEDFMEALEAFQKRVGEIMQDETAKMEVEFPVKLVGNTAQDYFVCKEFNDNFEKLGMMQFFGRIVEMGLEQYKLQITRTTGAALNNVAHDELLNYVEDVLSGEDTGESLD